jgi:hypothetical protein
MLALSSLTKSRRFVAVMYAGLLFFTAAMSQVLSAMTGTRVWAIISPGDVLEVFSRVIFRIPGPRDLPFPAAVVFVVALLAACIWVLERRVRGTEVVT